jgi:hypothetical protein
MSVVRNASGFEGTLSVREHKDPVSGQAWAVFHMADSLVVARGPTAGR